MRPSTARDAIAQRERLARGGAAVALLTRHFAHAGIEKPCALRGGVLVVCRVGGGEVAIGKVFFLDMVGCSSVKIKAFGLPILFVPVEAQPAQAFEDGLHAGVGIALDVGVVKAQDHRPAVVAGIEPVEDKRARAADVKKTGRRGRKSDARTRGHWGG